MQWAGSIEAADGFLNSASGRIVIVTELALADGNWRDLVERVRGRKVPIPIVLMTSVNTAELWWDALECGVDDIVPGVPHDSSLAPTPGDARRTMNQIRAEPANFG
jgi:DNA-binding NarL/FixJ family response regulator